MRLVWIHDLRLAWRHPEIRREVLAITAWKAVGCLYLCIFYPILLIGMIPYFVAHSIAGLFEWIAETIISGPAAWIGNRRRAYYRPIRRKLEAKGAMQWQINGERRPLYYDDERAGH